MKKFSFCSNVIKNILLLSVFFLITNTTFGQVWSDNFETDKGWTLVSEWERGAPGALGGEHGNPDPATAQQGTNVLGTDLTGLGANSGDYEASLGDRAYTATSPVIDCSAYTNVHLTFQRWLNIESPSYDHAYIDIWDGSTWQQVWTNDAEIADASWSLQDIDISAYADGNASMQVRFSIGATDGSWFYSGWNIDDLIITGSSATPMTYVSSTVTQPNTTDVPQGGVNQEVICIEVVTTGSTSPLDLDQVRLRTNGSTDPTNDITNAKLWYTGTSSTFATTTQVGATFAPVPATGTNYLINGTQTLVEGTNYFWVSYDIEATATIGNNVDALCNRITVDGTNRTPSPTTDPVGNRTIFGPKTIPYTHNFDTQDNWTTSGTASIWERGDQTNDGFGPPSGHSGNTVYGTKLDANYAEDAVEAYLETPLFSMSGTTAPRLSFWMDIESESGYDGGILQINVNGGGWTTIDAADYTLNPPNDATVSGLGGGLGWTGTQPSDEWQKVQLNLFNLTNTPLVITNSDVIQVRFWFGSDGSVNDYPGWYIDDFAIYEPNDQTTQVDAPTSGQIAAGNIASTITTNASAVNVFNFDVTDQASGDGVSTFVTTFVVSNEGTGTADWTDNIGGAELWSGGTIIPNLDVTITDTEITFSKSTGSFEVTDGTSKEITMKIWLNNSGIVDNSTMVFEVPTTGHGFKALETGSEFADPLTSATTSNTHTITVTATQLLFTGQPSPTAIATPPTPLVTQPIVSATDANGNVDIDITSLVTLANTGSLTMNNNSMNFVAGVADFNTPANFEFTSGGKYVFLTATAPGLSSISPSSEIAVDIEGCTIWSEDFESATDGQLPRSGWDVINITGAADDWGITSASGAGGNAPITGNRNLEINRNGTHYIYRHNQANEKIAYYGTIIDARNYQNVTIDFNFIGFGELDGDYAQIVWSTDAVNWQLASPATTYAGNNNVVNLTNYDISVVDGQQFYIGFKWINDGDNTGDNVPIVIDDIVIKGFPKFDYNFSYRQDNFEQITGTVLTTFVQDGENIALPAGFDFEYDGTPVTDIRANLNGWLEMGTAHNANPVATNDLSNISNVPFLAPLWDDLTSDAQTRVIYLTEGTAPTRTFTVEWKDVLWGGQRQNFQVKLYETSYVIEFWYGEINTPTAGSASIGINNDGGCLNRLISITPGTTPTASYTAENSTINLATYLTEGLIYIFNPLQMQSYKTWQEATIVVGQPDFATINTVASQTISAGAYSSNVSSKGVLASTSGSANRVMIWNTIQTSDGAAADVVLGQADFTATASGISATTLQNPHNVCFTPDGNKIIVVDASNNRVLIWNTIPTDMSGAPYAADVVIGQTDFTSSSSGTSATKLSYPTGAIVLPNGKLLISDFSNNRVLVFNQVPTTNGVAADYVIGQPDLTTTSAGTTADKLGAPWDCAFSPDGKLLISDDNSHRVLIYNEVPLTSGASADLVIGNDVFGPKAAGSDKDEFDQPSVTVSVEGKIAIADFANSRIMMYERIPKKNGEAADYVLGQPNFLDGTEFNDGFSNIGSADARNMHYPYSICFDLNGRLYVNGTRPDGLTGMHRIMIYGETPTEIADLEISIVSNETDVCIFSDILYTIEVTNNGADDASSVVVNAQLPVGMTLNEYDASLGTYNSKSGYWMIPYIANGQTVTLTFEGEVQPDLGGKNVTAYANIVASKQADSDFSNNGTNQIVAVKTFFAPTSTNITDQYINRNSHTIPVISFTVDDQDGAGDYPLVYTCSSSNTTLVPLDYVTNLQFAGAEPNKTLDIYPATDEYGYSEMSVILTDSHGCYKEYDFLITVGNIWKGVGDGMTMGSEINWTTTQNWSSGFVPTSSIEAIIPTTPIGGYFPIIDEKGDICEDLIIEPRANVIIEDTYGLHIYGDLSIQSDATGTGSFVDQNTTGFNQVTLDGDIFIDRYITHDAWHYLSSPITGASNQVLTEDVCGASYNGNVLDYNEAFSFDYDGDGDTDWFDGWEWPWYYTHNSDPLIPTNGYAYYTFAGMCSHNIQFTGTGATLNTGNYTYNVTNQDDGYAPTGFGPHRGWNLVGNPYPSGLNANSFLTANAGVIDGTIYLWDENGMTGFNLEGADYASFNGIGATGTGAGGVTPDKYISCGQGFFVHRTVTDIGGTNIIFNNSMREAENSFFFKNDTIEFQKIKLSVQNENNHFNQIIVALKDDATDDRDIVYDGFKMQGNPDLALYSKIGTDNFAIQALAPLSDQNSAKQVPIGLYAGITGTYTFNLLLFQNIPDNMHVFIEDTYEGEFINLAQTSKYVFSVLDTGTYDDRFILHFNINNAPTVVSEIDNIITFEDEELFVNIPNNSFNDIDEGDILSYELTMLDGNNIPSWITFDNEELVISALPTNNEVGTYNLKLTATDIVGASVYSDFELTIINVNDAPILVNPISDIQTNALEQFVYTIPENTFMDIDFNDNLRYEAYLNNGSSLPTWLIFNADTRTFSGTPSNYDVSIFDIKLYAFDNNDAYANDIFELTVNEATNMNNVNNEFYVYPNPSNGKFIIENINSVYSFTITDATGKVIFEGNSNTTRKNVDISNVAEGIYMLNIIYNDNTSRTSTITIVK